MPEEIELPPNATREDVVDAVLLDAARRGEGGVLWDLDPPLEGLIREGHSYAVGRKDDPQFGPYAAMYKGPGGVREWVPGTYETLEEVKAACALDWERRWEAM